MSKKNIFLFMGPPGSGKGTLSALCVEQFGWVQLATGNLCREHVQLETDIGVQIRQAMKQGELVSDELIATMVSDWILSQNEIPKGIIFDGYPRTAVQAKLLYQLLQDKLQGFNLVLVKLNVADQVLIDRILSRVMCSNKDCQHVYSLMKSSDSYPKNEMVCDECGSELIRRSDDTRQAIEHRIHMYYQHEQDILDFYVKKGMSIGMLNGSQAVLGVFNDFKKIAEQNNYVC